VSFKPELPAAWVLLLSAPMESKEHWEGVYRSKGSQQVSWYEAVPRLSIDLIEACDIGKAEPIIDVGGGASSLVDALLDRDYTNITVLDISATALELAQKRLGDRAGLVKWIVSDVLDAVLPEKHLAVWHDRAVFHFLTRPEDRARYVRVMRAAVKHGAGIVMATFGPNGPRKCSGLDVMRYSGRELLAELGPGIRLLESFAEMHPTPAGTHQEFQFSRFDIA
jgi:SAM-dependent methyltransferase